MAKYNLSKIMTRAWAAKKKTTGTAVTFSDCLKASWIQEKFDMGIITLAEANEAMAASELVGKGKKIKETEKANHPKKEALIEKLEEKVAYCNERYNFNYSLVASDWAKYGKNRTYFAVYETSDCTRHNVKIDFGYFDNISEEYVAGRKNIEDEFDCCGGRMTA